MLGPDQPVILHLLDIEPTAEALKGAKMELADTTFPLLRGTTEQKQKYEKRSSDMIFHGESETLRLY